MIASVPRAQRLSLKSTVPVKTAEAIGSASTVVFAASVTLVPAVLPLYLLKGTLTDGMSLAAACSPEICACTRLSGSSSGRSDGLSDDAEAY
jgi:hypothetical protein